MFKITSHCTHCVLGGTTQTRGFFVGADSELKIVPSPLDRGSLCSPIRNLRIVILFNHFMTLFHANSI